MISKFKKLFAEIWELWVFKEQEQQFMKVLREQHQHHGESKVLIQVTHDFDYLWRFAFFLKAMGEKYPSGFEIHWTEIIYPFRYARGTAVLTSTEN